jgi:hypothetical protein
MSTHRNVDDDATGFSVIARPNVVGRVTDNPLPDMSVDKSTDVDPDESEPPLLRGPIPGNVNPSVLAAPSGTPVEQASSPSVDLVTITDMLTGEPMTIGADNRVYEGGGSPRVPQTTPRSQVPVDGAANVPPRIPPVLSVSSDQITRSSACDEAYQDRSVPSDGAVEDNGHSTSKTGRAASALLIDITPRGFIVAAILAVLSVDMFLGWTNRTPFVPTQVATVSMDRVINMGRAYFKAQGQDTMRAELSTAMLLDVANVELTKISKSGRFIAIIDADAVYGGDTYDISAALFDATIDASPDLGTGQAAEARLARTKAANAPTFSVLGGE